MQSHPLYSHTINTTARSQIVDLTPAVAEQARAHKVRDGMAIIFCPHTTAAITINENYDPAVKHDLLEKLQKLIPQLEAYYQHDEGNSDAHLKTAIVGNSATVLIEVGKLVLGRWQGIYFCEFDGPRERRCFMKFVAFA